MHILIVDDSPTTRRVLADGLTSQGVHVVEAADGEKALQLVAETYPDIVVLDIILPKQSGYQVCRTLKRQPKTKNIPVIILTSKSGDKDRDWGIEQGADAYLTKPVELEELLQTARQLVGQ